jgi:adenine/guanine phosphoribosyltransferase-like PRPP-binding protein
MKTTKNMISKAKNALNNAAVKASTFLMVQKNKMRLAVANNSGENYIDSAVKILIAVVLGGLLLAGLYALFGDVVMPTLKTKIQEMFNYKG